MTKIVIVVQGGVVQGGLSDSDNVTVFVQDYDTEDCNDGFLIDDPGGSFILGTLPVEVNPDQVSHLENTLLSEKV